MSIGDKMELEEQLDKLCDDIVADKIGDRLAITKLRTLRDDMGKESFSTAMWEQSNRDLDRLLTIADKLGPVLYSESW